MDRIDRVVWRGKVITSDRVMVGDLVYRNDEPFQKQRALILKLQRFMVVLGAGLIALTLILFGLSNSLSLLFSMFGMVMVLVSSILQIAMWKSADRGMVVHNNGVDAMEYRAFSIGRVFVPWEEIWSCKKGWLRFTIYLKHSRKKIFCHKNMVDDMTIWHIQQLPKGGMPEQKEPELVIYSDDGVSRSMPQFRM